MHKWSRSSSKWRWRTFGWWGNFLSPFWKLFEMPSPFQHSATVSVRCGERNNHFKYGTANKIIPEIPGRCMRCEKKACGIALLETAPLQDTGGGGKCFLLIIGSLIPWLIEREGISKKNVVANPVCPCGESRLPVSNPSIKTARLPSLPHQLPEFVRRWLMMWVWRRVSSFPNPKSSGNNGDSSWHRTG